MTRTRGRQRHWAGALRDDVVPVHHCYLYDRWRRPSVSWWRWALHAGRLKLPSNNSVGHTLCLFVWTLGNKCFVMCRQSVAKYKQLSYPVTAVRVVLRESSDKGSSITSLGSPLEDHVSLVTVNTLSCCLLGNKTRIQRVTTCFSYFWEIAFRRLCQAAVTAELALVAVCCLFRLFVFCFGLASLLTECRPMLAVMFSHWNHIFIIPPPQRGILE